MWQQSCNVIPELCFQSKSSEGIGTALSCCMTWAIVRRQSYSSSFHSSVLSFEQLLTDALPQIKTEDTFLSPFLSEFVIKSELVRACVRCGSFACDENCSGKTPLSLSAKLMFSIESRFEWKISLFGLRATCGASNGPLQRPSPMLISLSWPLCLSEQSIGTKLWLLCPTDGLSRCLIFPSRWYVPS